MKKRGTHTIVFVWFDFLILFSSLKLKNFEWEWWKPKTPNWCFQFLRYITKWQDCKIFYLYGAHSFCIVMSAQTCLILPLQIQGRRPFLFLSSLKIFQLKFFPLSHFPLTFHYFMKSKHKVGLRSFLCNWVWTEVGLKSFLCPSQRPFEHSSMIFSQVRISLSPSPSSMTIVWFGYCGIIFIDFCPRVLVSVLKWVFLHGLIFDLSFFL